MKRHADRKTMIHINDADFFRALRPDAPGVADAVALPTLVARLNQQLGAPGKPRLQPWRESHWSGYLNFAYDDYKTGFYTRALKLRDEHSPLLLSPCERPGTFVRQFDKAFVIAKPGGYGLAIHTGPVGKAVGYGGRPYGCGGGELSVFWTPRTGSVIVGRRRGVQGRVYDRVSEWRLWPVHAVSGITRDNEVLSSARIEDPQPRIVVNGKGATVRVSGQIPKYNARMSAICPSSWRYERSFTGAPAGLTVTTKVASGGQEQLAELYETIPVFLRETARQKPATIRFEKGGAWIEATATPTAAVTAVRVDRFTGAVVIRFARPRTVRLSPTVWQDGFQTRAECRTVLVDLLEAPARPAALTAASVQYTITPLASGK